MKAKELEVLFKKVWNDLELNKDAKILHYQCDKNFHVVWQTDGLEFSMKYDYISENDYHFAQYIKEISSGNFIMDIK